MSSVHTPPHLAEPQLTYATEAEADAYVSAVVRGFHSDYVAEQWEPEKKVFEWDRDFGFKVDDRWIATCGAHSRVMAVPGGRVPVAAVTIVTVAPAYRRRGLLNQMMKHQLEDVQKRGTEPVALLWASESLIYGRYGYGGCAPRTSISGPTRSTVFRPGVPVSGGSVDEVTREEFQSAAAQLREHLLNQRPGALERSDAWWDVYLYDPEAWRDGATALRFVLHYSVSGQVDGYAYFRTRDGDKAAAPGREVVVHDLDASDPAAYAALWRYLLDLDLVRSFSRRNAPVDEPLRYLVADQRAIKTELSDATYSRIVDVAAALAARTYTREIDTVIELHDALLPDNSGTYRLEAGPDGATVTRTGRTPDLAMEMRELGSVYLGGTSLSSLHRSGLVEEHRAGSAELLTAAFGSSTSPFCNDYF